MRKFITVHRHLKISTMNEHIIQNLEHYLSIEKPQYAVLLSGKWGSGKTFFIDKFLESKQNKDIKFIKISLFGLKNIPEVNNKIIFKLLNLNNGFFGQIAKAAQSYNKKLNLPIQDLPIDKIFNIFNKSSKKEIIFIFDDLERVSIEYSEILGYINYFVEQSNFKVIILANEIEIKDSKFTNFKEKVIGKTFEIQQDFDTILDVFLNLVPDSKSALEINKNSIKSIYDNAGYNNLRHIRQTILDFDYFYKNIDNKFKKNDDFLKSLICIFFAFSIEVKKGELKINEIKDHGFSLDRSEEKTNFNNILDKYHIVDSIINTFGKASFLIGKENWENILFKGNVIKDDISTAISQTKYFANDDRESWVKLLYFYELEDAQFTEILSDVVAKFKGNKYQKQPRILHVIAILLFLSKKGFCNTTQENILKQAKKNINANAKTPSWKQNRYRHDDIGAYSLSYMDEESDKFKETIKYLVQKSDEAFNIGLKSKANTLLQYFKDNNTEELEDKLVSGEFYNVAIFSQMNPDNFIDTFLDIKHIYLRRIVSVLIQRYEHHPELKQELEFWQNVDKKLLNKIDKETQKIKHHLMTSFKNNQLKEIINSLKKEVPE